MGNTNSINQKRMGEILQNALHSGDLEKAKEIWVAGYLFSGSGLPFMWLMPRRFQNYFNLYPQIFFIDTS